MLVDRVFWNDLEDVEMMLRPLNEAQRQSKSDGAHIGFLISRWMKMKDELERLYETGKFPQLASIIGPEGELSRQTSDIHWAAYCLDPTNASPHFEPALQLRVTNFLKRYVGHHTEAEWAEIVQQFFDFQNHERLFDSTTDLWNADLVSNPRLWWQYARSGCYKLATLAIRIFSTPANSVPSERAFSTMNYLLD